jgi:hypothetical protein
MVVRKNISLEQVHLKKLDLLTEKHGGNLSAAIRDAIDITETALARYGTVEEAIAGIKKVTSREKSIESSNSVLVAIPLFQWLLGRTKGIPLNIEIINELLDPLKINTISLLDKEINIISRESGMGCEVSIFSMDDINPENVTVTITGENELYRTLLSQMVVLFLSQNKALGIDVVHKRSTGVRLDLKKMEAGAQAAGIKKHFGYLKEVVDEFKTKGQFWRNMIEIFKSVDYNMVSLYKDHYEDLLTCNTPYDPGLFESISKKHIKSIPHGEFLLLIKNVHESLQLVDKMEIINNDINIYHKYKKENAIQKVRDYYMALLKANGHEYDAKCSTSLIVLHHICCKG